MIPTTHRPIPCSRVLVKKGEECWKGAWETNQLHILEHRFDIGGVLLFSSNPQVIKCAEAGADLVRITVQGKRESKACKLIREKLDELVG